MRTWRDLAVIINKKGLDGGLVLQWSAGLSCVLKQGQELHLVPPRMDAPREVHLCDEVSTSAAREVVFFSEIEDATVADRVCGCHVLIDENDIDSIDEAPMSAGIFVGWTLIDATLGEIGVVKDAEERFEQVLLYVNVTDAPHISGDVKLIPLVDDIIVEVDEVSCKLTLDCPQGLFDI